MKKGHKRSIRKEVLLLAVLPVLILGVSLTIINMQFIYRNMVAVVENQLSGIVCVMEQEFSKEAKGQLEYRNGTLYSGGKEIVEQEFVDSVKRETGVDVTIFWGEKRIITSVLKSDGERAVGTVADNIVVSNVLSKGEEFFSEDVSVNGVPYFGFYIPIEDKTGNRVGMIFAGKPSGEVKKVLMGAVRNSVIVSVLVIAITIALCIFAARRIIFALEKIKEYMQRVEKGQFDQEMDSYVLSRHDELRDMGISAVRLQKKVKKQVFQDPLTGLFNRRACLSVMSEWMEEGRNILLAMGDIDYFKSVNDKFGHLCGDFVLQEVSSIIERCIGENGIVCRYGGEEFLIACDENSEVFEKHIGELVDTIRNTKFEYEGCLVTITMTIGMTCYQPDKSLEENIDQADQALYVGKRSGRDQVVRL